MDKETIIKETEEYIKKRFKGESTGHGWWHIQRVLKMSLKIAEKEKVNSSEEINLFVVQLAALLHDIADWKFNSGDDSSRPIIVKELLEKLEVDEETITQVYEIIKNIFFKGGTLQPEMKTLEGKIVLDADRLDALGAIGIARTFAYGGFRDREIYNPNMKPIKCKSFEEYKNYKGTSINHFYEKMLLLKDRMNTETGKKIAEKRHKFIENFLEEFFGEWEGTS
ncbi:MAG: HD domain-containing protein [Candidatus Aenigmarchaeota archaeon]|nr:HD domain-containing protein [Candidatus Aenigmarchaeota archaeon]